MATPALTPTMQEGSSTFIEYWDKGAGARVRAELEAVSVRLKGSPFQNASDPDWFISVNGGPRTQVKTIYFATDDMRMWDAKVHTRLVIPAYNIFFRFEFIGNGADFDGDVIAFWDWNGALWEATIPPLINPIGDVQPSFKLKKR